MTAKETAAQLAQRVGSVVQHLLPKGKKEGNEWCVGNVVGEEGKSLKVCLQGDKIGVWCDFATGEGGDLLDLWALNRRIDLFEAIKEANQWLGLGVPQFEAYRSVKFVKPSQAKLGALSASSPVMNYLTVERKLTTETIHAFNIGEKNRMIIFPYWRDGELIFVKFLGLERINGKKQITVEKDCEPCLFGWHLVPPQARTIILCEGEIDAMSLYQYGLPALSVPFGGGTGHKHKWLEYEFDRLAVFDEIILCFDNDSAGKAAVAELIERLGRPRCRVVELPHKDANACLQAGISKEQMHDLFRQARNLDPEELKRASTFVEQVINEFYPTNDAPLGWLPPWEKAKEKIIFRPDELSIWTGINGHGKSQFLGHLSLHFIKSGARVCIASLELKPRRLLTRLTRQAAGMSNPSVEQIRAVHDWYGDHLWLFDLVGTAKAKRLLEVFLYARQRYGIDVFIIDSMMKLDIAEDDYKAQKILVEQLCDFKNQHNCHIHLIVHPRKASDETKPPGKLDNKGTGAISDLADNCFSVWRNKKKEEIKKLQAQGHLLDSNQLAELATPDCVWICDKQRNGDWEGKIGLGFDAKSLQYLNHPDQKPAPFVQF